MKYLKLLFVICLLSSSGFASGQALKGVREVAIVIENLDDDATKCLISKDLLDASVRLPLSNSKIKIVSRELYPNAYVYANVNILTRGDLCIGSIEFSFNKYSNSEKEVGTFWTKETLLSRGKADFSRDVSQIIESYAKQLISAWLQANL